MLIERVKSKSQYFFAVQLDRFDMIMSCKYQVPLRGDEVHMHAFDIFRIFAVIKFW